jgi:hypothetical protein
MPRTKDPERRDNTLLEAILTVQSDTSEIKTNQAVQGEKIGNIESHLEKLNGKVATQEANTSTLKSAVDILINKEGQRSKIEWLTIENLFKLGFALLLAFLLYRAGI